MNHLVLRAQLIEKGALRYTPAGIPALDFVLKHESELEEAGRPRKVSLEIKALALGEVTQAMAQVAVGSRLDASGFLAAQRNGRGVVFHITQLG